MIVQLAGESIYLLPQRALYWPRMRMLVVADIHFGKAASFRARGIPVPHGTTSQNLAALDALLAAHDVVQIMFLGDFLHAKEAHAEATLDAIRSWRALNPELKLTLVRGNHDLHAGDPPAGLAMEVVDEPHALGPFAFCHHPGPVPQRYALAGHMHPMLRLSGRDDSVRLPCFMLGPEHGILPSFGAFTGGFTMTPEPGQRFYVTTDDAVFAVPLR